MATRICVRFFVSTIALAVALCRRNDIALASNSIPGFIGVAVICTIITTAIMEPMLAIARKTPKCTGRTAKF